MARVLAQSEAAPEIDLRQESIVRHKADEHWSVIWVVENKGPDPLQIVSARLPHGQFKADERRFEPPLNLAPGASCRFLISVRCHEPPGLVTENAFVIFSVIWADSAWRIFVRVRVVAEADGTPWTATELITAQKVGFSGEESNG